MIKEETRQCSQITRGMYITHRLPESLERSTLPRVPWVLCSAALTFFLTENNKRFKGSLEGVSRFCKAFCSPASLLPTEPYENCYPTFGGRVTVPMALVIMLNDFPAAGALETVAEIIV